MFDFDRWCSWMEAKCQQENPEHVVIEFRRGRPSPKPAASVAFKTERKLMELAFWVTGEADFYGEDLRSRRGVVVFNGRLLDDHSFEQTFQECLAYAASN